MITQQLLNYIKINLERGYSEEQLRDTLIRHGYKPEDVEEAFRVVKSQYQSLARPEERKPEEKPREEKKPEARPEKKPEKKKKPEGEKKRSRKVFLIVAGIVFVVLIALIWLVFFTEYLEILFEGYTGSPNESLYEELGEELEESLSNQFLVTQTICINGKINMFIQNVGIDSIKKSEITIKVDGADASEGLENDIEFQKTVIFSWNCGTGCSQGDHTINVKTNSTEDTINTVCS
jgi:flagellar basal body-associated protein FliL